jgi:hypothetical protein
MNISLRKAIEARIINFKYPKIIPEHDCFDTTHAGLEHWDDLVHYYRANDDTDIGVEVMREYMDRLNDLLRIAQDTTLPEQCHDEVEDAVSELQMHLNEIINHVEFRLYPNGR